MKKIILPIIALFLFAFLASAVSAAYVEILPSQPIDTDNLYCHIGGLSHPYTPSSYLYKWFKNSQYQSSLSGWGSENILASYTSPGQEWRCEVYMDNPWGVPIPIGTDYYDTVIIGEAPQPHTLNVTSIECFPVVIVDGNQACSVFVEDESGPVGGADITIHYLDGSYFGECVSDHISGGCIAHDLQGEVGTFTVYATAELEGYINDTDTYPRYTYEVWAHEYNITELMTYNDSLFQNPDDVFYRGEDLYVKFKVIDLATGEYVNDDIVTAATLISVQGGGRVNLTRINFRDDWYYYELSQIPLTHQFIGWSQVFAFAFNVPEQSGGQAQVDLTILNNPPEITPEIEDITFNEADETYSLGLSQHEFDLEDSGSNLRWTVQESSPCINADIHNKNLVIIGLDACEADITLRLYDLDNDYDEQIVHVTVTQENVINVTSIECFPVVIVGGNQDCSVFVEDQNGVPVGGADITLYYIDGSYFGECVSNGISGGCTAQDVQEEVGTFTVYAIAEKEGYIIDNDTYPRYTYQVWDHDYNITGLAIYNDSAFQNPDDVFYRGEDLYIKFQVIDLATGEYVCEDIVTAATLISRVGGGRINMSRMTFDRTCCWYYYELEQIPLTHDFIGDSNVFAFAFNIPEQSGGQAQADLTILNNPPVITPIIPDITTPETSNYSLNLAPHEFDLEDAGNNLRWTLSYSSSACFTAGIEGKTLIILPTDSCESDIVLRLYDLDDDYDQQTVHVTVTEVIPENMPPNVTILQPQDGAEFFEGEEITFVGHGYDIEEGVLTGDSLTWTSNIDGFLGYGENLTEALSPGEHIITLKGTDSQGAFDTDTITIYVEEDLDFTGIDVDADPSSGVAPLTVEFSCHAYGGNAPISYSWTLDGVEEFNGQTFTHTFNEEGNYTATCTAYDSDNDEISCSVIVRVTEYVPPVNEPPVISKIPGQLITGGESFAQFDLDNYVYDPDDADEELTWTYSGNTNIHVNIASNHVVTLTYPVGWSGSELIVFTVHDPSGLSDYGKATFTVRNEEQPVFKPTVDILQPAGGSTFEEDVVITFAGTGTDPEDGQLTGNSLSWTSNIDGFMGYGESITKSLSIGTHTITLRGVDSDGLYDTDSITVYITEKTIPFIPECSDGVDNDGDDLIDMDDPGCYSPSDDSEFNLAPGTESGLLIERIRLYGHEWQYVKPGHELQLMISLHNNADDDLEDLRVTLMIPDLGIKVKSSQFDLDEDDETTKFITAHIPSDVSPGLYYAEIQVSNAGDLRRIKYDYFIVED